MDCAAHTAGSQLSKVTGSSALSEVSETGKDGANSATWMATSSSTPAKSGFWLGCPDL